MPLEECWLEHLEHYVEDSALRSHVLRLAADEGLRLFHEGEAPAAALHFQENGFVVLRDALKGDVLKSLQQASAQLIRDAERRRPEGNRGNQRWSLGRTTGDERFGQKFLETVDNEHICSVLECIWSSKKFTVLCSGGDFSLPGAAMQRMHADIAERHKFAQNFAFHDFVNLPTPPTIKVYLTLTDLDAARGPPVFVPGSHLLYAANDVPEVDPDGSKYAYCPCGSAILMDLRVWHHGSPNKSSVARPMLSLHYAAPWYCENVLRRQNPYWMFHRGVLSRAALLTMRLRARQLCCNLVYQQCEQCSCPADCSAPAAGWYKGSWYCESCWLHWKRSSDQGYVLNVHDGRPLVTRVGRAVERVKQILHHFTCARAVNLVLGSNQICARKRQTLCLFLCCLCIAAANSFIARRHGLACNFFFRKQCIVCVHQKMFVPFNDARLTEQRSACFQSK